MVVALRGAILAEGRVVKAMPQRFNAPPKQANRSALGSSGNLTMGVGTPCWLAPEIIRNASGDLKVDVFAFGLCCVWVGFWMAWVGGSVR